MPRWMFEQVLVFTGIMTAMGLFTKLVLAFIGRGRTSKLETKKLDDLGEQIARLQTAVDAMAVEVERIGEGQRFAVRLMSKEESSLGRLPASGRTTPH